MHADAETHGQPGGRQLLQHLEVDLVGLLTAAELLAVREGEQPGLGEQREDLPGETPRLLLLRGGGPDFTLDEIPYQRQQVAGLLRGQPAVHRPGAVLVHAALSSLSGAATARPRVEAAPPVDPHSAQQMIAHRVAEGGDLQLWR
ncbi:hypothetical protein ADL21_10700 [Streptomyces albus subsp. albus]|nr:hypothetical protein ADL21_10700 [Streptomyces albus subsp. albus]